MATIYEVAALAGVSPATVSRVFNGVTVSPEKSRLVKDAAAQLSFTPNRAARNLRRQNSDVIALVIPDIENPFFTSMARGVEDVAHAAGYSVVLCNTDEDHQKEATYLHIAVSENMAGVILAATGSASDLSSLVARGRPIVAVDRGIRQYEVDTVVADNRSGGLAATRSLIQQGFTRIACITGPVDVETAQQRSDGWREAMHGVLPDDQIQAYLRHANYRVDGGRDAMIDLLELDQPPEAVFVTNNLMSVGALQVLVSRGLTPPDAGFATFGDLPFASLAPRGITVVHVPARQIGVTAATLLMNRIGGDEQPSRTIVLRNELSTRD
ncbi:MAG: LacI family DNA-binding transcriptional regulator [Microbacteriaceae bacterium]